MPITLFVRIEIKPEYSDSILDAFAPLITGSQAETGCINYQLHKDQQHDNVYWMYEIWQSQAALDTHNQSEHYRLFGQLHGNKLQLVELHKAIAV